MKHGFRWDKKYLHWGVMAFCVIACAIVFYMALNYISALGSATSTMTNISGALMLLCRRGFIYSECLSAGG